jgi:hypothetical protein
MRLFAGKSYTLIEQILELSAIELDSLNIQGIES